MGICASNTRLSSYRRIKKIGKGSFGICYLVETKDKQKYVEKVIKVENEDKKTIQSIYREISNLIKFISSKYY